MSVSREPPGFVGPGEPFFRYTSMARAITTVSEVSRTHRALFDSGHGLVFVQERFCWALALDASAPRDVALALKSRRAILR
jgi:hypothetical protein